MIAELEAAREALRNCRPIAVSGRVVQAVGLLAEAEGLPAPVGSLCAVGNGAHLAEVVGFRGARLLLMAVERLDGVEHGDPVKLLTTRQGIRVGPGLLGRVIDAQGRPLDGGAPVPGERWVPLHQEPPDPLTRPRIRAPLGTGIRAIDGLITVGKGQRMGIFSGSGVGKSVLMGMICRNTDAPLNVVALIGERGREVREFVERDLGPEGLARSVVVVATGEQSPVLRLRAALAATAIAEYFRDLGRDVLLMMDSVTRIAYAQREIGLSAGEPPATKGYPPSVYSLLPKLLERAGLSARGSITGLYTVLVEADDVNEPIADAARSILDGHIWLSRRLANRGHYPAIDPLESVSRVMPDVVADAHLKEALEARGLLATYQENEDLINLGAYVRGANPRVDRAIALIEPFRAYLRQGMRDRATFPDAVQGLHQVLATPLPAPARPEGVRAAPRQPGEVRS